MDSYRTTMSRHGVVATQATRMVGDHMMSTIFVVGVGRMNDPETSALLQQPHGRNHINRCDLHNDENEWGELLDRVQKHGMFSAPQLQALCRASNTPLTTEIVRELSGMCSV